MFCLSFKRFRTNAFETSFSKTVLLSMLIKVISHSSLCADIEFKQLQHLQCNQIHTYVLKQSTRCSPVRLNRQLCSQIILVFRWFVRIVLARQHAESKQRVHAHSHVMRRETPRISRFSPMSLCKHDMRHQVSFTDNTATRYVYCVRRQYVSHLYF